MTVDHQPPILVWALANRRPPRPADGNPFTRPHPEAPWVDRGLPERSKAKP